MGIRFDRLEKLAAFLDTLPRKKFRFDRVWRFQECGTVGCAIGWTPVVFPHLVRRSAQTSQLFYRGKAGRSLQSYDGVAAWLFGMSKDDAVRLFTPSYTKSSADAAPGCVALGPDTTPKLVAKNIRRYIAHQQKVSA